LKRVSVKTEDIKIFMEREKLGAGSFGEVFRAQRLFKSSESLCTIKKITFKSENEKDILKEIET
jgi:serine/threonine protein kinase